MRRLLVPAALLIAMLVPALPSQAATVRVQRFSGFQDVRVTGASQTRYRLRLAYTVPGTWRVRGRAGGLTRTFGPIGSCRFTVRVSARAVADASETAAARVARLLPVTGPRLLDVGTRSNAAWRVARPTGSQAVTGLLVRPAPSVTRAAAAGDGPGRWICTTPGCGPNSAASTTSTRSVRAVVVTVAPAGQASVRAARALRTA